MSRYITAMQREAQARMGTGGHVSSGRFYELKKADQVVRGLRAPLRRGEEGVTQFAALRDAATLRKLVLREISAVIRGESAPRAAPSPAAAPAVAAAPRGGGGAAAAKPFMDRD